MANYSGTSADDSYWGGSDADRIEGQGGRDFLLGQGGDDEIFGGEGDDNLVGGQGNDLLEGGDGDDHLQGNEGVDVLRGQDGNDRLLLISNDPLGIAGDSIDGGEGIDTLQFDGASVSSPIVFSLADPAAAQTLAGATVVRMDRISFESGSGDDDITGGALNDDISGGEGDDRIDGGGGNDNLAGGSGINTIYGGAGNDLISGGTGNLLYGEEGDDGFNWRGDSLIDGGAGTDSLRLEYFGDPMSGITVDLSNPDVETLVLGTRVTGIEKLRASSGSGHDRITGGTGDDIIEGQGGDDILAGGSGNDILAGGDGYDELSGGGGDDRLVSFASGASPLDKFDGGDGYDELEFRLTESSASVAIDLLAPDGVVIGIERIFFSALSTTGAYDVAGAGADDIVMGGLVGDRIQGRGGNDDLRGGGGEDFIYGGDGDDFIDGEGGSNWLEGGAGNDSVRSGSSEGNRLDGGTGDDEIDGGSGVDTLIGGDGLDFIVGRGGADSLEGGAGADRFFYYNVSDSTSAAMDRIGDFQSGLDKIELRALGNVRIGWTEATDPGTGATYSLVTVTAAAGTSTIRVDSTLTRADFNADTSLSGTGGNDNIDGTGEADEILGLGGDDVIRGLAGNDSLAGGDGNDRVEGGEGDDTLGGNAGDDVLIGGQGDDSYSGGEGIDTVDYSGEAGPVAVNLTASLFLFPAGHPHATRSLGPGEALDGAGNYETLTGIEYLILTGGNDRLVGSEETNRVEAGAGSDNIDGAGGNDALFGQAGNDRLSGDAGDDLLAGGTGDDTMFGGSGNDIYVVDSTGDIVTENAGQGTDIIETGLAAYSLFGLANVENLKATSAVPHDLRGNLGNNLVIGNARSDFIRLQDGGNDTVLGGLGNDVFLFGSSLDGSDVVEGDVGTDQIAIQGDYSGSKALTLGANVGRVENLALLAGNDTRFGDPGTSFYDYNITVLDAAVAAGIQLIVDAGRLQAGEDFAFNGSAELDGSFFIYGGGGADNLTGGAKNDVFLFGAEGQWGASDVVNGGSGGIDQLALRGNYTLTFGAGQLVGIDQIGLLSAHDTRYGAMGSSYSYDLTMVDSNVAAGAQMTVDGGLLRIAEHFRFDGSAEQDGSFRVFGGLVDDVIVGSRNADILQGNAGSDTLTGGEGADVFRYVSVSDSTAGASDQILDFAAGSDKIDLSRIDANGNAAGDQAFSWIGSTAFSGTAGQLRAYQDGSSWFVEGDTNGDGVADLVIQLNVTGGALSQSDFLP